MKVIVDNIPHTVKNFVVKVKELIAKFTIFTHIQTSRF